MKVSLGPILGQSWLNIVSKIAHYMSKVEKEKIPNSLKLAKKRQIQEIAWFLYAGSPGLTKAKRLLPLSADRGCRLRMYEIVLKFWNFRNLRTFVKFWNFWILLLFWKVFGLFGNFGNYEILTSFWKVSNLWNFWNLSWFFDFFEIAEAKQC